MIGWKTHLHRHHVAVEALVVVLIALLAVVSSVLLVDLLPASLRRAGSVYGVLGADVHDDPDGVEVDRALCLVAESVANRELEHSQIRA